MALENILTQAKLHRLLHHGIRHIPPSSPSSFIDLKSGQIPVQLGLVLKYGIAGDVDNSAMPQGSMNLSKL